MSISKVWEDMVALNVTSDDELEAILSARNYARKPLPPRFQKLENVIESFLEDDNWPLPSTQAREGYYGSDHFLYWLSGALDFVNCKRLVDEYEIKVRRYLDLGSATARVARHVAAQMKNAEVYAADINLRHIRWINQHFEGRILGFQNTSIPHIPLESNSVDLVTAFSVFSHIEAFDHAWLLEIRRILTPGGLFILTANVDNWADVNETWPVYKALRNHKDFVKERLGKPLWKSRVVFRWNAEGSYSSIVFMRADYVTREWSRIFQVADMKKYFTTFQTGVFLRKATV